VDRRIEVAAFLISRHASAYATVSGMIEQHIDAAVVDRADESSAPLSASALVERPSRGAYE